MPRTPLALAFLALPLVAFAQDAIPELWSTPAPEVAPAAEEHGIFPLWGDKVRAKGFDLPKPFGFMVNYYYQKSDIHISNLKLGFNGGPMYDAGFIQIPKATAWGSALAIRPSLMVLPFLSLYAVYSSGKTETTVNITSPVEASTTASSGAQVLALGATFQIGWRGYFAVADFNGAVSDVDRLADLVGANVLSFRLGKAFRLDEKGQSLSVWAGTLGQVIDVETSGTVRLADVLPPPQQSTIDSAQAKCDAIPPSNAAQKLACNQLVQKMRNWANGSEPAASVDYSLDKKPASIWNLALGGQYALDKYWMFRAEVTFLGGRSSVLAGVEYRFDI
ncbi:MAG TPA: hypothetical protein VFG53_13030 [Anaeromyxobacter sp.]|nr:hypothetical protein [Anaeromyxobacter sp.]